jgi:hypothetical protein
LVEQLLRKEKVNSSIPLSGTTADSPGIHLSGLFLRPQIFASGYNRRSGQQFTQALPEFY